jgi:hypothetical protein
VAFESQAAKGNCIVDNSLKIVKLIIKNAVRLILDDFDIVVFSFSAVYQWIRLTSLFILIVFCAQKPQNILF